MKTHLLRLSKPNIQQIARILIALVILGFFGQSSFAQITGTTPSSRCGEGTIVLHATASSGTIKWYDVPFYGTAISLGVSGDGTTFTTPTLAVTKTYYVDAVDASNCSLNSGSVRVPVIATISASSIQASIFYASTTFCKSVATSQEVTRTGTAGGVYSYSGGGGTLSLNTSTGAINPATSNVGTYIVTYAVTAAEGCTENPAATQITITTEPSSSSISYTGSPFCTSLTSVTVNLTNDNSGTFSANPSGLSIDAVYGTINPSLSLPGTYSVTYTVSGAGGCAPQSPSTQVTITGLPTASIAYSGTPFCKDLATAQLPELSGTGAYTGGTYSATGITINSSTGAITPSTSNAGTYTITYTAPASANCNSVAVNTTLTINAVPTGSLAGTTTVCKNETSPDLTFTGGNGTTPYTFVYQVNGGTEQSISTVSGNNVTVSHPTGSSGTFVYNLLGVTDSKGCSFAASGTATITVSASPIATFNYVGSPYCKTGTILPTYTGGGRAGTFTSTAGLVFVSASTGEVNLATSAAGNYTVTNTISGCGTDVTATANISINPLPTATISGNLTQCVETTLTVTTNASSPSYAWFKDNVVLDGLTNATLLVNSSGNYKVKVTDGTTGCEFTSSASAVTIHPLPTASISGNLTSSCASTILTAVTDAASASYVWYYNEAVITGQVSSSVTVTDEGVYQLKVTNNATGCVKYSDLAEVSIFRSPSMTSATQSATVCDGSAATINLTGLLGLSSSIIDYKIDGVAQTPVTGILANPLGVASFTSAALSASKNGKILQITSISANECTSSFAQNVTLSVDPTTVAGSVTGGTSVTTGTNSTVLTLGTHTGSVVRWESSTDGSTWSQIVNTNNTYTATNLTTTTQYRAVVKSGVCSQDNSSSTTVIVTPQAPTGAASQSFCSN